MEKQNRLRKSADFQRVRQHGSAFAHPLVVLIFIPNQQDILRVGITTGKSIGNAVQRNRAKRVLNAAISGLIPQIQPGYDIVLQARRSATKLKSTQLQLTIYSLLEKARILLK
ncbi:MAG: ribonuclease P protein component [Chloroflexota bacterium]